MLTRIVPMLITALLLFGLPCSAQTFPHDTSPCKPVDERTLIVPDDFKIIFGSGPLHADWGGAYSITIEANGDVTKTSDPAGRRKPGQKPTIEKLSTSAQNVMGIYAKVVGCAFFDLDKRYWNPKVRDGGRQYLAVTAQGKTHDVAVYYWTVDRFQAVASAVRKIAAEAKEKAPAQEQLLTAEKAEQLVWALPEVKEMAAQISRQGAKPFTRVELEGGGPSSSAYTIYFGEDHKTHTVRRETFIVDRKTGNVSVYDVVADKNLSLAEWRSKK
jgi:hypothetical protein